NALVGRAKKMCTDLQIASDHIDSLSSKLGEIQGAYQIKITTTALALLLASRHNKLAKVNILGHLIK
ncbi:hypothetical protein HN51_030155, partial [Arachis hypogaea]